MIYDLEYDYQLIASVKIDEEKAMPFIREMVEFWMNWEQNLERNGGDYVRTWLKLLGMYVLEFRQAPENEEGFYPLDGSCGITVTHTEPFEFSRDELVISKMEGGAV